MVWNIMRTSIVFVYLFHIINDFIGGGGVNTKFATVIKMWLNCITSEFGLFFSLSVHGVFFQDKSTYSD